MNYFVGMNYINGEFCPARPDLSRAYGTFPLSTIAEIVEAVSASKRAYGYHWRDMPAARRSLILEELLFNIYSNYTVIYTAIQLEMTYGGARQVQPYLDYKITETLKQLSQELSIGTLPSSGSTAFITSWRFGIEPVILQLFRALQYGNTVIWTPDSNSCVTAQIIVDLANQTRLSAFPGVLQLLHGDHNTANELLNAGVDASIILAPNVVGMANR